QPRRAVDGDVVGAQPGQRVGQEVLDRLRTPVVPAEPGTRPPQHAELDAQPVTVPPAAPQRLGEQQLVVAHPVEVAGVDQGDAGVQRGVHGGDALRPVGGPVGVGHAHRAQPQRGDLRPGPAQGSCPHLVLPRSVSSPTLRPGPRSRKRSVHRGSAAPWMTRPAARFHGAMQREELADFLRRRREAIGPADVGLAEGPRRRTAGLRREEVALLAGMSVDYVVRLEQGRSSRPSTQLLGALAGALRLPDDERDHLFHLAGHRPPPAEGTARLARAGLIRMLDLLVGVPALVMSDLGEVLAQNRMSVLLGGDHTGLTGDRRYLPYRWFTEPEVRALHSPEEQEHHARQLVADLRAVAGRRPDDPAVGGLVGRLRAESAEFRRLWAEHEVAVRRADRKTMVHPRVGRMLMDCETLVTLDQRQMLVVLTPANTEARERLDLLHVLGTQDFPTA